jgi:hypothetical protein
LETTSRNKLLLKCIIIRRNEELFPDENLDVEHDIFDIGLLDPFLLTTLKIAHTLEVQSKYKNTVNSMGTALIKSRTSNRSNPVNYS